MCDAEPPTLVRDLFVASRRVSFRLGVSCGFLLSSQINVALISSTLHTLSVLFTGFQLIDISPGNTIVPSYSGGTLVEELNTANDTIHANNFATIKTLCDF